MNNTIYGGTTATPVPLTITDQTYKPTSENAQSGKAVAEAIGGKADKEEYRLIHQATLEESDVVTISTDTEGKAFALKKLYIRFNTPAIEGDSTSTQIWLHAITVDNTFKPFLPTKSFARNRTKHGSFEAEIKAFWHGEARCTNSGSMAEDPSNLTPYGVRIESTNSNPITAIRLCETYNGALPSGTYFEIWGVRA